MKRKLIRVSLVIGVIASLISAFSVTIFALTSKGINYDLDEELFDRAKIDGTVYYYAYYKDGSLKEIYKTSQESRREWVDIGQVSNNVLNAFLAMEDRDFYNHKGVNIKRTLAATINHFIKYTDVFGASTITQQVIKNISGDNETNIKRKLKEILRAFRLEKHHSKDDIFELYLNVVPMSGNIYGVCAAADIYFGKAPSELSAAEAATIVGITNAPSKYNPYTKAEACIEKRNKVLYAMRSVGYLTIDQYEEAIKEPMILSNKGGNFGVSSWFVETANEEIISDICEQYKISRAAAGMMLNGSRIILTVNPIIQEILESYFTDTANLSDKFSDGLNYSMVVCDPHTGDLLGVIGNGGEKHGERLFNYAIANIIPGSVLKPLAIYAPLIDDDTITWSSMIDDSPTDYLNINGNDVAYPKNSPDFYDGPIDINDAIKRSKNTVAVRLYNTLGAERIYRHLFDDYGFTSIIKNGKGIRGEHISDLSAAPLALGQLSYGVPLRRLTEAYCVFPNEGILNTGRSYTTVYDKDGKEIINKTCNSKRLYSTDTARIMNQLLSNVVADGTAKQIKLKELIDVAGKTGTSGNDRDRLFVGYTPYVSAGIWCGYGNSTKAVGQNTPCHLEIWDEVMKRIHERLFFNGYSEPICFKTDGLLIAPYCPQSGCLPTEWCELNDGYMPKIGYFKSYCYPQDECDYHKQCLQIEDNVI